eukprot:GFYU01007757.1.p1 GENE.GFYU01007757.1~~GFYU01007757.1.p1  ORF type:complete len:451 (+),score=95.85 GFYU01007757.1:199-1551(+)
MISSGSQRAVFDWKQVRRVDTEKFRALLKDLRVSTQLYCPKDTQIASHRSRTSSDLYGIDVFKTPTSHEVFFSPDKDIVDPLQLEVFLQYQLGQAMEEEEMMYLLKVLKRNRQKICVFYQTEACLKIYDRMKELDTEKPLKWKLSKIILDFDRRKDNSDPLLSIDKTYADRFEITNLGRHKIKFDITGLDKDSPLYNKFKLTFQPHEGVLAKGQSQVIEVSCSIKGFVDVMGLININIMSATAKNQAQTYRHHSFVALDVHTEASLFGVPPSTLPQVTYGNGTIPQILEVLRENLYKMNGLNSEGIFRLAPDEQECHQVKDLLNKGKFVECKDVNCLANLIKVWFREMPSPLLNAIDWNGAVDDNESDEAAWGLMTSLPEASRLLLTWLMDLMVDVVKHEEKSRMGPKQICIVLAPNLFQVSHSDPMQSLMISQRVVIFIQKLLSYKMTH